MFPYDVEPGNNCQSETPAKADSNICSTLRNIRKNNSNKIVIAHRNINTIKNKIDLLADIIKGNVDILMISESKLDNTFPDGHFVIEGFGTPFRSDRNRNGGELCFSLEVTSPLKLSLRMENLLKDFLLS